MADVFISYAREDRESAKLLAEAIQARGWSVWWDRRLLGGAAYEDAIERELDAARCVMVLWTHLSVASDWVRNEAAEGVRRRNLIPVRLEDVRLALSFRHLQTAEMLGWTGQTGDALDECLASIEALIGPPRQAVPKPPVVDVPVVQPHVNPPVFTLAVVVITAVCLAVIITFLISRPVGTRTVETDTADTAVGTVAEPIPETSASIPETSTTKPFAAATMTVAEMKALVVDLETAQGTVTLELFPDQAPNHARKFLELARSGALDGANVSITASFGIAFDSLQPMPSDEPNDIGYHRGIIMSSRSFFWILTAYLPGTIDRYAFGRVIHGMEVVDRISKLSTKEDGPITIKTASVRPRA